MNFEQFIYIDSFELSSLSSLSFSCYVIKNCILQIVNYNRLPKYEPYYIAHIISRRIVLIMIESSAWEKLGHYRNRKRISGKPLWFKHCSWSFKEDILAVRWKQKWYDSYLTMILNLLFQNDPRMIQTDMEIHRDTKIDVTRALTTSRPIRMKVWTISL